MDIGFYHSIDIQCRFGRSYTVNSHHSTAPCYAFLRFEKCVIKWYTISLAPLAFVRRPFYSSFFLLSFRPCARYFYRTFMSISFVRVWERSVVCGWVCAWPTKFIAKNWGPRAHNKVRSFLVLFAPYLLYALDFCEMKDRLWRRVPTMASGTE